MEYNIQEEINNVLQCFKDTIDKVDSELKLYNDKISQNGKMNMTKEEEKQFVVLCAKSFFIMAMVSFCKCIGSKGSSKDELLIDVKDIKNHLVNGIKMVGEDFVIEQGVIIERLEKVIVNIYD